MNINATIQKVEDKARGNTQRLRSAYMPPEEVDAWFSRNQGVYVIGIDLCQSNQSNGGNHSVPMALVVYVG